MADAVPLAAEQFHGIIAFIDGRHNVSPSRLCRPGLGRRSRSKEVHPETRMASLLRQNVGGCGSTTWTSPRPRGVAGTRPSGCPAPGGGPDRGCKRRVEVLGTDIEPAATASAPSARPARHSRASAA